MPLPDRSVRALCGSGSRRAYMSQGSGHQGPLPRNLKFWQLRSRLRGDLDSSFCVQTSTGKEKPPRVGNTRYWHSLSCSRFKAVDDKYTLPPEALSADGWKSSVDARSGIESKYLLPIHLLSQAKGTGVLSWLRSTVSVEPRPSTLPGRHHQVGGVPPSAELEQSTENSQRDSRRPLRVALAGEGSQLSAGPSERAFRNLIQSPSISLHDFAWAGRGARAREAPAGALYG